MKVTVNIILMNIFVGLAFFLNSCYSYSNLKNKLDNEIKGIELNQNFPQIDDKGKLLKYDKFITRIYYCNDLTLYQLPYHFESLDSFGNIKPEFRNHFFVYQKGRNFGYDYNKHNEKFSRKVLADSLFNTLWFTKINPYQILILNESILISSSIDPVSKDLYETFTLKGKIDSSMSGRCSLVYRKSFLEIPFSLSKELDSIKQMKLCKVELVNNSRFMKDKNINLDRIVQTYTLEIIEHINLEEVKFYFEKYLKEIADD